MGDQRTCSSQGSSPAEVPYLEAACLTECPSTTSRPFRHSPLKAAHHQDCRLPQDAQLHSARREPYAPQIQIRIPELRLSNCLTQ